jgi:hypothetical protein
MRNLERGLQSALGRKPAPSGFADRVLEQLDDTRARRRRRKSLTAIVSRVAAVLLVGAIGLGAWMQHQQSVREMREAEAASVLVKLALHIASEKTNIAREQLSGGGSSATSNRNGGDGHETTND